MTVLQSLHPPSMPSVPSTPSVPLAAVAPPNAQPARLAESARYALLRRLAPAIRHDMAGALQPISMVAAMLEKRLQKPDPDLLALGKNVNAINALARDASLACMQLMTWLSPRLDEPTPVATGVAEAIALVATDLSFKGFVMLNQCATPDVGIAVRVGVLRGLFMAALLALTDSHPGPAHVLLNAQRDAGTVVLSIAVEPREDDQIEVLGGMPPPFRNLDWDDVRALAAAEAAVLVLTAHRVELRLAAEQPA